MFRRIYTAIIARNNIKLGTTKELEETLFKHCYFVDFVKSKRIQSGVYAGQKKTKQKSKKLYGKNVPC